nr:ATP-dependent DNA helicase [Paenibacillus sp. MMS18-CY102]
MSVRELVEYAYRSGDLTFGFRGASALTEGTRIHQAVQAEYGETDEKEFYLQTEVACDGFLFVIDGRCDGLLQTDQGVMIDEIKSTSGMLPNTAEESPEVHWAQAICYGYMYASQMELKGMLIRLTYVSVATGERRAFVRPMTLVEMEAKLQFAMKAYVPYADLMHAHEQRRIASAQALAFPFAAYRAGQRKLAGAVYQAITDGSKLFAKAPTGIGKTISTLFPAVKAMGEGRLSHLVYLTAKTITRTAAEDAFALMEEGGLHLHSVTLTAKDKICFQEEVRCSKEHCPYADGYYDRINGALLDMLGTETRMSRTVIEHYARKHRVCPFEMSLDAAYAADALIGDYNYIFDPRISLKRLFEERKRHTAVLVDEAHNLVDRGREMYSAELNKGDYLQLMRSYKEVNPPLAVAAKSVNAWLLALRKKIEQPAKATSEGGDNLAAELELAFGDLNPAQAIGETQMEKWEPFGNGQAISRTLPKALMELLESFVIEAERELAAFVNGRSADLEQKLLLDTYYGAQHMLRIAKLYDERFITMVECFKSEVRVKLFCLDPSLLLRQAGKGFRAHIFFSATLSPLPYYVEMLGGLPEEDFSLSIPSPFLREQLDVQVMPLSIRYRDREESIQPIAAMLHEMSAARRGNFLAFFPSYDFMNKVYEQFEAMRDTETAARTILQANAMREEEREAFLQAFQAGPEGTLLGFAVMGGIFSEGIDLVGDRLIGVVVVGVGLPQVGMERDVMRDYYEQAGRNGFHYAYVYPGMNKVLQAGGRLIRSENDRGTLVLVDDRYLNQPYNRLLPEEWRDYAVRRSNGP